MLVFAIKSILVIFNDCDQLTTVTHQQLRFQMPVCVFINLNMYYKYCKSCIQREAEMLQQKLPEEHTI